jgi:hypothetical protein
VVVDAASSTKLSTPFTLSARVTDDGLPKPVPPGRARGGRDMPPIMQGGVAAPVNVPQVAGAVTDLSPPARWELSATFMAWRGPASVVFNPRTVAVRDGKAQTTVSFTKPGEYVLRVRASDGLLTTAQDVKVTVSP